MSIVASVSNSNLCFSGILSTSIPIFNSCSLPQVACRELGYQEGLAVGEATFGAAQSTVHIWLDQVSCVGNEQFLSQCTSDGWGSHNCIHREDAGVVCSGKSACHNVI